TEIELKSHGFQRYDPFKGLFRVRVKKEIIRVLVKLEFLLAEKDGVICFIPATFAHKNLYNYHHCTVKTEFCRQNYIKRGTSKWDPTPAEIHLLANGCRPYYKAVGIWALKLPVGIYVQSLESPEPAIVPAGRWLCIGVEGEPYNMNDHSF